MQSNIRTCVPSDPWKASRAVRGFVNNLAPREEKPTPETQDKEIHSHDLVDGRQATVSYAVNPREKPPRMGRMKKKPMRVGPVTVMDASIPCEVDIASNDAPAATDSVVNLASEPKSSSEQNPSPLILVHPPNNAQVPKQSKQSENNVTNTPKVDYLETKEGSRPVSEHSSSSMSDSNFRCELLVEDTKLVISSDKPSTLSWIPTHFKSSNTFNTSSPAEAPGKTESSDAADLKKTENQNELNSISPLSSSSPHQISDEDAVTAVSGSKDMSDLKTYSFDNNLSDMNESNDILVEDKGEDSETNVESRKNPRSIKLMRCKMCNTEHYGKETLWQHLRKEHPKENHLLCDYCPFATRYRHHYEYHVRNHRGEKPFKCDQCGYRCVNKSMLASHMKSHTTVYEYKCDTCSYETKYYHSLKQHIEKTNHHPFSDKLTHQKRITTEAPEVKRDASSGNGFQITNNNVMLPLPGGAGLPILSGVNLVPPPPPLHNPFPQSFGEKNVVVSSTGQLISPGSMPPPMFLSPATKTNNFPLMTNPASAIVGPLVSNPAMAMQLQNAFSLLNNIDQRNLANMDHAQAILQDAIMAPNVVDLPSDLTASPLHILRKRIKLEVGDDDDELDPSPATNLAIDDQGSSIQDHNEDEDEASIDIVKEKPNACGKASLHPDDSINPADLSFCKYCKVYFVDPVAYQVHAGNHNFDDPFKCNRCGHRASDAISFMNHGLCGKH